MAATIVVGTQWGDEGKGKIVDYLAEDADIVARFQGGNNAGHTIVVGDQTFKLHFIPSGIIRGKDAVLGNGMVLEPKALLDELHKLEESGVATEKIMISDRAHVILPECLDEDSKDKKIGTTKRGIGPTYAAKISRTGAMVCQVLDRYPGFKKYAGDASLKVNQALDAGKKVLFEGAQGTHLDIDFGTYPFVTSSNTIAGGACTGSGVGPTKIEKVVGVVKAYTTRVGNGPFPTELDDETGGWLRKQGAEFGTTTGRPRRCGWFDAMLVKYSVRLSGISEIALTKLDVLSGLDEIKICTAYSLNGQTIRDFPSNPDFLKDCTPVYEVYRGWGDLSKEEWRSIAEKDFEDWPEAIRTYVEKLEELLKTPIKLVSYGPARSDTFIKG